MKIKGAIFDMDGTLVDSLMFWDYLWKQIGIRYFGNAEFRPDVYLLSMNTLGLPAEEICVFEDSFVALETARGVGFKTVGLYDQYNFDQERLRTASDIYIDEFHSLLDLIAEINA